jgi:predicted dehydrogenase
MSGRISVEVLGDRPIALDPLRFDVVDRGARVVLAARHRAIDAAEAVRLREFVRGGGGLVLLGGTLAAWSALPSIAELAGWLPGGFGPETELIVRPDAIHPVTQRMPPEWKIRDRLYLAEGPPVDASVLLRTSWRYTEQVVAFERTFGEGRFVYIGLRDDASTTFAKLLGRAVMFAAGHAAPPPTGIGLLGYGAIGSDHAASIAATSGLRLASVCDLAEERRVAAAREWSVHTYARAADMLADPNVGLVVVGTPPSTHTQPVLQALEAGKHVVCEKPFALSAHDGDRMIDAAASRGLVLTVYQSRRWDPDFIAMRDLARSGSIGEPFYLESFIGGYDHPCDLWHSHEPISGGTIYDWGSHYFDWIMQLFADSVRLVEAQAHKRVWHDVTNADQVRVDVTFAGGQQAMFLQSEIAAARKPKWYLLGSEGALVGEWAEADVPSDYPARLHVFRRSGEERLALPLRDPHGFYRNLADHLAWGEPLAVTPLEARRTVAVMEAATESISRGGAHVKVDI